MATFLFLNLFFLSTSPAIAAISPAGEGLRIFFSNDVHGETEPCG
jgi:hypothetical protein